MSLLTHKYGWREAEERSRETEEATRPREEAAQSKTAQEIRLAAFKEGERMRAVEQNGIAKQKGPGDE